MLGGIGAGPEAGATGRPGGADADDWLVPLSALDELELPLLWVTRNPKPARARTQTSVQLAACMEGIRSRRRPAPGREPPGPEAAAALLDALAPRRGLRRAGVDGPPAVAAGENSSGLAERTVSFASSAPAAAVSGPAGSAAAPGSVAARVAASAAMAALIRASKDAGRAGRFTEARNEVTPDSSRSECPASEVPLVRKPGVRAPFVRIFPFRWPLPAHTPPPCSDETPSASGRFPSGR